MQLEYSIILHAVGIIIIYSAYLVCREVCYHLLQSFNVREAVLRLVEPEGPVGGQVHGAARSPPGTAGPVPQAAGPGTGTSPALLKHITCRFRGS